MCICREHDAGGTGHGGRREPPALQHAALLLRAGVAAGHRGGVWLLGVAPAQPHLPRGPASDGARPAGPALPRAGSSSATTAGDQGAWKVRMRVEGADDSAGNSDSELFTQTMYWGWLSG